MKPLSALIRPIPHRVCVLGLAMALIAVLTGDAVGQSQPTIGTSGSVLGDDVLYTIGGGSAVAMGSSADMQSIGVGLGWNNNLICGNLSLSTTLQNQLNGVTQGFQTIMSQVIQNATSAVASLPALIIQRADPGLYNLLTNGILQARLDFDRSKATCRAMADKMADLAGGAMGWGQIAQGQALKTAVGGNTDAVAVTEQAESQRGNDGVPWVGGGSAGGARQTSIKVVGDVTRAGYNLLNGRSVTDTSPIDPGTCGKRLTCATWSSPDAAAKWATRVLGEQEARTCDDCTSAQTTPGVGLTPLIQEEYDTKLQALQDLVTGAKPTTLANLEAAGSDALPVTRGVVEALRDEPDQLLLMQRLASEVALSSILEKALLLQRTLLTGSQEPNVAVTRIAEQAISRDNATLEQEINNLKSELELRRELAGNGPSWIVQRQYGRGEGSRRIFQGDAVPDRLDRLQTPAGTRHGNGH
nr:integrating conjugative element protein [Burkholderia pseudomallei]